jgi:hypothetical protein
MPWFQRIGKILAPGRGSPALVSGGNLLRRGTPDAGLRQAVATARAA